MPQNLISLDFSADEIAKLDEAIATLEAFTRSFATLTPKEKQDLNKMGDKSAYFCQQTAMVLEQNQDILPPSFDYEEMRSDLASHAVLAPRVLRLREALTRMEDAQMQLGSDAMVAASEGYALMKMFGKTEGIDELQQAMRLRRPGRRRKNVEPAA